MDKVYKKALIHHTVQKVMNIDEINFPYELKCPITRSKFPFCFQLPIGLSQTSVQRILAEEFKDVLSQAPQEHPFMICIKVNDPDPKSSKSKANPIQRIFLGQRGDEDQAYRYKIFFYNPVTKTAYQNVKHGGIKLTLNPAPIRLHDFKNLWKGIVDKKLFYRRAMRIFFVREKLHQEEIKNDLGRCEIISIQRLSTRWW